MNTDGSACSVLADRVKEHLDQGLRNALLSWQVRTCYSLSYWLRGHCASFAAALAKFIGNRAQLLSVLANDGNVHHIVVVVGDILMDARGIHTTSSLLDKVNREAQLTGCSLRAVRVIPCETGHLAEMKDTPRHITKELTRSLNAKEMRQARRLIKAGALDFVQEYGM